jgi:hypothetical protein
LIPTGAGETTRPSNRQQRLGRAIQRRRSSPTARPQVLPGTGQLDFEHCRWTERTEYSELPLTPEIVRLFLLFSGGTIQTVTLTLQKTMVIDCDLHQGNGTAHTFQDDDTVFTFSIHQEHLYPEKQCSDLDIHLPNGVSDKVYLDHLRRHLPRILDDFQPQLILYQAGVDPYEHDQLGDLRLTKAGLLERDRFVLKCVHDRRVPIAVTLGGGYAFDTEDTVGLHLNTCLAAWQIWGPGK